MRNFPHACLAAALALLSGHVLGWECDIWFFEPTDYLHESPLAQAPAALADSLRQAKQNVALEQRNVAISFETGYMVTACPEMALFWYRKAAAAGDEFAKDWMSRYGRQDCLRRGAEFGAIEANRNERCMPEPGGAGKP